jgi:hypothetical protein
MAWTKEQRKEYFSNYYKLNREKDNLRRKLWKIKNKEKTKLQNSKYKKDNKFKVNVRNRLYADKKKNPNLYPKECIICHTKENITFHHPNYDFEYSVYPMCREHHDLLHFNLKKSGVEI